MIPTSIAIRKEGASKGASVSFLISTPATGVDSILATYSLLGLPFAILRPVAAFVTALFGGVLTNFATRGESAGNAAAGVHCDLAKHEHHDHEHHDHDHCECGESCGCHEHGEHDHHHGASAGSATLAHSEPVSKTYRVNGMNCNHCKACVEKAVRPLDGVVFAEADVASKSLHVEWHDDDDIDMDSLKTAVEEAGFEFVGEV